MRFWFKKRSRQPPPDPASDAQPPAGLGRPSVTDATLDHWRLCEQRVERAWNAWIAAPMGRRETHYRNFLRALADEERAAAAIEYEARMDRPREPAGC